MPDFGTAAWKNAVSQYLGRGIVFLEADVQNAEFSGQLHWSCSETEVSEQQPLKNSNA
jgi:hypothetical protein